MSWRCCARVGCGGKGCWGFCSSASLPPLRGRRVCRDALVVRGHRSYWARWLGVGAVSGWASGAGLIRMAGRDISVDALTAQLFIDRGLAHGGTLKPAAPQRASTGCGQMLWTKHHPPLILPDSQSDKQRNEPDLASRHGYTWRHDQPTPLFRGWPPLRQVASGHPRHNENKLRFRGIAT